MNKKIWSHGVPGSHIISQSEKEGLLIFGVQIGLHLPLLESGPTSYGQGPRIEHFVSDAVAFKAAAPKIL